MKTRTLFIAALAIAIVGVGLTTVIVATSDVEEVRVLPVLIVAAVSFLALLGLAAPWALRLRRTAHERATRLANLERRMALLSDRMEAETAQTAMRGLEERVQRLHDSVAEIKRVAEASSGGLGVEPSDITASLVALGESQGLAMQEFLSPEQAAGQVRAAVATGRILDALPYLDAFPVVVHDLELSEARALFKGLRRLGYLGHAQPVIESIADRFGNPKDARAAELYASELALYRGEIDVDMPLPPLEGGLRGNVVMHLVGKALPETQSGYTLRSQYTVEAQRRLGIEPVVVAQAGASDRAHQHTETYEYRGIRYYLLGGPQRGVVPWNDWLRENVAALADVVRLVKPAAIHTHSDFMNAMIALPVARAYGIPVVNETRGFWEESWLSRTANAERWADLEELEERVGLPDMYRLRVEREAHTRNQSDAVVTLARVMRQHIQHVGQDLEMPAPPTSIAPNSVQAEDFPVLPRDEALRADLGIEPSDVIVGYISSIVEYEGIDTLIQGVFELQSALEVARALEALESPSSALAEAELTRQKSAPFMGAPGVEAHVHAEDGQLDLSGKQRPSPVAALHDSVATTSRALGGSRSEHARAQSDADISDPNPGHDSARASILSGFMERLRLVHPEKDDDTLATLGQSLLASVGGLSGTGIRLMIVGDGAELKNLVALAAHLSVDVLFTGRVPHESVLGYYGLIDLFVVPRKRAAVTELVTPLKPFEALSTGRPCVFSDVKALAEIATDSGCIELFKADDHHDLALTIGDLLGRPDRLAQMSREGARWVRAERSWDNNARTYLEVYQSLGLQLESGGRA